MKVTKAPWLFFTRLAALLFWAVLAPASHGDSGAVSAVRFSGNEQQTRIVIEMNEKLDYRLFTLAQNGLRLIVDMPSINWQLSGAQNAGHGQGAVAAYRYGNNTPQTSRLVFDLNRPVEVTSDFYIPPGKEFKNYRLVLDLKETDPIDFAAEAGFKEPFVPRVRYARNSRVSPAPSRKPRASHHGKRIIIIDAGHGGKDPGAIGRVRKYKEKDINLKAALTLRKRLLKSGRYDVRMTRTRNVFVELKDRVKFARKNEGDLLISLHSDSAANPRARGASVYTKIEWAASRSKKEILHGKTDIIGVDTRRVEPGVGDVLVNLTMRDTQNQSAIFAEMVAARLKRVGPILPNAHRDKNLFVLLSPDVPAVLVEMGYLSNRYDEANLGSSRYMNKLMGAVGDAVDSYFKQVEHYEAAR